MNLRFCQGLGPNWFVLTFRWLSRAVEKNCNVLLKKTVPSVFVQTEYREAQI